jgi:hypothetical protein
MPDLDGGLAATTKECSRSPLQIARVTNDIESSTLRRRARNTERFHAESVGGFKHTRPDIRNLGIHAVCFYYAGGCSIDQRHHLTSQSYTSTS